MASLTIQHQDNACLAMRKENADVRSAAQRRKLFARKRNQNIMQAGSSPRPSKNSDETQTVRQRQNVKNVAPPVAQFGAFCVYEDKFKKPSVVEVKRKPTLQPFVAKDINKESFINAAENVRALRPQVEKQSDQPSGAPPKRVPLQVKKEIPQSPMSVANASILSMAIEKRAKTCEDVKVPLQVKKEILESPMSVANASILSMAIEKPAKTCENVKVPLQVKKEIPESPMSVANASILSMAIEKPAKTCENVKVPLQVKKEIPESPMSVANASILSMAIEKRAKTCEDVEEDTTTEETDTEMFVHDTEYWQDTYEDMRDTEVKHRAKPGYMRKQPHITYGMRSMVINWLVDLCEEFGLQNETLFLAVSYIDRFLSYMSVVRTKLQLLATAAIYVAAKYEEVSPPNVWDFVDMTDGAYTMDEVLRMERLLLQVLSFDLTTPTALAFLEHYSAEHNVPAETYHLAAYILEVALLEAEWVQFKPSELAAAALATASHARLCRRCPPYTHIRPPTTGDDHFNNECMMVAWNAALAATSGYSVSELAPCLRSMARTHAHARHQPYQAPVDKYSSFKYQEFASTPVRPLCGVPAYSRPVAAAAAAAAAERNTCRSG